MDGEPAAPRRHGQQPSGSGDSSAEPGGRRRPLRLLTRTASKAWTDGIFGQSAQAAFWQALSLPPLLLGLLGIFRIIAGWFGDDAVSRVEREIIDFSDRVFTDEVVEQIIQPTVHDVLYEGNNSIISIGFVLSLWAGSSALASLVDAITKAYSQHKVRHPVWQRIFALLLYLASLSGALIVLPLAALGPDAVPEFFPESTRDDVDSITSVLYYPVLGFLLVVGLATLYKIVLPNKPPWRRGLPGAALAMLVFIVASVICRHYITWINRSGSTYTYGALATPIAFLLICFFIAFAIILGAQFNNAIDEMWAVYPSRRERRRWRRLEMERRTQRDLEERSREHWHATTDTVDLARPTTAVSPADVQPTVELHRNGAPDAPTAEGNGAGDTPNRINSPDEPPQRPSRT